MNAQFRLREPREVLSEEVTLEKVLKNAFPSLCVKGNYLARPLLSVSLSLNGIAVSANSVCTRSKTTCLILPGDYKDPCIHL